jgi:hypothetical protein
LAPKTSGYKAQTYACFGIRFKGKRLLGKQQGSCSDNTRFPNKISSFQVFS